MNTITFRSIINQILLVGQNDLFYLYIYVIGIGSVHQRTGDVLAYLHIWTDALILNPATTTVLSLTFAQYFLSPIMGGMSDHNTRGRLIFIIT